MKRLIPAVLLALLMAVPAWAQQGTTELRGQGARSAGGACCRA